MPIDDYLGKIEGIRSSNRVFRKHTNLSDNDLEDYIILESKSHDSHSYPDLLVSKKRSHLSLHWFDAHKALNQENSFMLNLRQFVDYLMLLKSGKVYDGKGRKLHEIESLSLFRGIIAPMKPFRAEWLDAYFKADIFSDSIRINYNHKCINNSWVAGISEQLHNHLENTRNPGINLENWLIYATFQGLPDKFIELGDISYFAPCKEKEFVAWFDAIELMTYLTCQGDPQTENESLGVRPAKFK